jgi:membrane dipeptidase
MNDNEPMDSKGTILLDAAAPLLAPRWIARRLPDVRAGGVDAVLATAGAIEDFRTTMEVVARGGAL